MRFSFLFIFVLLLILQGCTQTAEESEKKSEESIKVQSVVHDGVLRINDAGESYVLADDALDYRVIPSPDSLWLAVETQLLSNLQIIRVYKKESRGRYHPLKDPVAVKLWDELSKKEDFSLDDIRYPRMSFLYWADEGTMFINMSGAFDGREIDRNVTFHLRLTDFDNFESSK